LSLTLIGSGKRKRKRDNEAASSSSKKPTLKDASYEDVAHSTASEDIFMEKKDAYRAHDSAQGSGKTAAQLAFERQARRTEKDTLSGAAALPYRQRVDEYNKRLASLSEHHDIPKVGPG
jgi:protein FAM32A